MTPLEPLRRRQVDVPRGRAQKPQRGPRRANIQSSGPAPAHTKVGCSLTRRGSSPSQDQCHDQEHQHHGRDREPQSASINMTTSPNTGTGRQCPRDPAHQSEKLGGAWARHTAHRQRLVCGACVRIRGCDRAGVPCSRYTEAVTMLQNCFVRNSRSTGSSNRLCTGVQKPGLRPEEEQERGRENHSTLGVLRTSPDVTSPATCNFTTQV